MDRVRIKFNGDFLNRFPPTLLHGGIANIYIVYELEKSENINSYPTLENCLFRSVKSTNNF